mgnify:CR=1 FL=1
MNKSDKIEAIYEKIADKQLKFWCIIKYKYNWKEYINTYLSQNPRNMRHQIIMKSIWCADTWKVCTINKKDITKIIWHKVMIWDVLYNWNWNTTTHELVVRWLWRYLKYPIEEQTDDCIDFVHNLTNPPKEEKVCNFCLTEDQFALNEDEQICTCDLINMTEEDFK